MTRQKNIRLNIVTISERDEWAHLVPIRKPRTRHQHYINRERKQQIVLYIRIERQLHGDKAHINFCF